ncbi:hypothetical protein BJY04DRAFT_222418 [Aspergillus karnatakaensis]|uniref:uncharacterized protein n=1 Tax=Aspergillus karnatakaensis TaxID=1810916 RepID=UPI003CCD40FD
MQPPKFLLALFPLASLIATTTAVPCSTITSFTLGKENSCADSLPCGRGACGGAACGWVTIGYANGQTARSEAWFWDNWENNDVSHELKLNGIEGGTTDPPLGITLRSEIADSGDRQVVVMGNGQTGCGEFGGYGCTVGALRYEGSPSAGEFWECA